jgi:hypothetical protein
MGVDESLPGALAWQRWLGLRRGRRGRCQVTRCPGGLVRCWPAGGDAWDTASQAAANLWWVHLVLSLFQVADRPTQPVGPGPLSQPHRRAGGARSRHGTTDRPGRPQQRHHTISTPTRRIQKQRRLGRDVLCFGGRRRFCGLRFSGQLLQSSTRSSSSQSRQAATGVATRMPQARLLGRAPLATATCGRMGNQNRPAIPLSRRSTGRIVTDKA